VYFSPVDDPSEINAEKQDIEISARFLVDPETDKVKRWSWGVDTTNENVEAHFTVSISSRTVKTVSEC
jgi:salicylate hydroxylase